MLVLKHYFSICIRIDVCNYVRTAVYCAVRQVGALENKNCYEVLV